VVVVVVVVEEWVCVTWRSRINSGNPTGTIFVGSLSDHVACLEEVVEAWQHRHWLHTQGNEEEKDEERTDKEKKRRKGKIDQREC
jgi:hypothetical protein